MQLKEFYSVGEVASICDISKKTLRFYDETGLMRPYRVCENNYRYYSYEQLLLIPVIKYYKQMGFTLTEMKNFICGNTYNETKRLFEKRIEELKSEEHAWTIKYTSVVDWYNLITEAQTVIEHNICEAGIKFLEAGEYCYLDQFLNNEIMCAIINIDFTKYIESIKSAITGPVMIYYPSYKERLDNSIKNIRILQKPIKACTPQDTMRIGGNMVLCCYHIGDHENIGETYEKIFDWATRHNYKCEGSSCERYVIDFWTTRNKSSFVTEIMINITK